MIHMHITNIFFSIYDFILVVVRSKFVHVIIFLCAKICASLRGGEASIVGNLCAGEVQMFDANHALRVIISHGSYQSIYGLCIC